MRRVRSSWASGSTGRFGSAGPGRSALLRDAGFKSGMRGSEAGNRNAERGARHIIEPDRVTELHAPGLSSVLPADADLQLRAHASSCGNGQRNKLANPGLVKDLEWIVGKDATVHIGGQEAAGIVSRQPISSLGEVVCSEGKELGLASDLVGGQRRARQLDHGTNGVVELLTHAAQHHTRRLLENRSLIGK